MSTEHILYIVISLLIISVVLFLMHFVKKQKYKDLFLFFVAMACFFVHISMCYVSLFQNGGGRGEIWDCMLLPIYFCNWVMYLLMAVSLWPNKQTKFFKNMATFVAWGGIFGALITLFAVEPGVADWSKFQSAISHSFLLLGSLWLFVGGYAKINVFNLIPFTLGGISSAIVGGLVIWLYRANGLDAPNAMYIFHGPNEAPMFTGWLLWLVTTLIIFVVAVIWEFIFKKKDERWYKNPKDLFIYFPKISKKTKTTSAQSIVANENVETTSETIESK